jgi:hypothetical protein
MFIAATLRPLALEFDEKELPPFEMESTQLTVEVVHLNKAKLGLEQARRTSNIHGGSHLMVEKSLNAVFAANSTHIVSLCVVLQPRL